MNGIRNREAGDLVSDQPLPRIRHDQDARPQAVPDLGVGEDDTRPILLDHPARLGQVFGQQVTLAQLREVLDVRRQVQVEAVAVLDDLARNTEQLQAIERAFALWLGAFDDLDQALLQPVEVDLLVLAKSAARCSSAMPLAG